MKHIILILVFSLGIGYTQNLSRLVEYEISFPDSAIKDGDGNDQRKGLPNNYRKFVVSLMKKAADEKMLQYCKVGNNISVSTDLLKFPVIFCDTVRIDNPYPPYELGDTVICAELDPNDVMAIKYYEKWESPNWSLTSTSYTKTLLAWTFIILRYDRNTGEVMGSYELKYLFLTSDKHLVYLNQQLTH